MSQINEVTQSLQDTATSNYRDENISFGDARKEPVKATETAVDLLESFAISTPTVKKVAAKPLKQPKPASNHDGCTAVGKEDSPAVIKDDVSKEVSLKEVRNDDVKHDDDVRQSKESKSHKQHKMVVLSSSEESDVDNDAVPLVSPITDDKNTGDVHDNSFTTILHDKLYPCHDEQPEVKWSAKTTSSTNNIVSVYTSECKQYSCLVHPAAPWHRCRQSNSKVTDVSCSSPVLKDKPCSSPLVLKDKPQETICDDNKIGHDEAKHTRRLRKKRRRESEHPSSDSETEPNKMSADSPAANEQEVINPTGTRTSKRVRRAPIKLRQ